VYILAYALNKTGLYNTSRCCQEHEALYVFAADGFRRIGLHDDAFRCQLSLGQLLLDARSIKTGTELLASSIQSYLHFSSEAWEEHLKPGSIPKIPVLLAILNYPLLLRGNKTLDGCWTMVMLALAEMLRIVTKRLRTPVLNGNENFQIFNEILEQASRLSLGIASLSCFNGLDALVSAAELIFECVMQTSEAMHGISHPIRPYAYLQRFIYHLCARNLEASLENVVRAEESSNEAPLSYDRRLDYMGPDYSRIISLVRPHISVPNFGFSLVRFRTLLNNSGLIKDKENPAQTSLPERSDIVASSIGRTSASLSTQSHRYGVSYTDSGMSGISFNYSNLGDDDNTVLVKLEIIQPRLEPL
jgi:hypothetical protein